jgi:hypothetical protein
MRGLQRLELINAIARDLQDRFVTADINAFFDGHGLKHPGTSMANSKWSYSRDILAKASHAKIVEIAGDLGLDIPIGTVAQTSPPRHWQDPSQFRLFVSHISVHKDKATRLRDCLTAYGVAAFVAHEDIEPTLDWQDQIERALHVMEAFVAIHTPGFRDSNWTQQEVGFAVAKGVKIISLEMGELPTGFISKQQALPRRKRQAEQIAEEIASVLRADQRTRDRFMQSSGRNDVPF